MSWERWIFRGLIRLVALAVIWGCLVTVGAVCHARDALWWEVIPLLLVLSMICALMVKVVCETFED
jgi:hypothetical protein